jgi:Gas vesicle synthesis protein GvpL/GvpF
VIQLCAITDHPGPPLPDLASLQLVAQGELAAVCAPAPEGEVTAEMLWEHERLIERLMDDRDLLPVRYGTRVPDAEAAARALEANHARLVEALEFVRGAVEVSVRVWGKSPPAETPATPTTGLAYMRARAQEVTTEDAVRRAIHQPLASRARAESIRPLGLPGELMHAVYLIGHDQVRDFSTAVEELQRTHPDWRIACTGPWPPYSFVTR